MIGGGELNKQSFINYKFRHRPYYPYCFSYKKVGDFLKNCMLKTNNYNLFLPTCYLYRNSVELEFKRIIIEDSNINRDKAIKILRRKKHSLLGLMNSFESEMKGRAIIKELRKYMDIKDSDKSIYEIYNYIREFHKFDPKSDIFRYPCNKNMELHFPKKTKFDIVNMSSCFDELYRYLNTIHDMLDCINDNEEEHCADYCT